MAVAQPSIARPAANERTGLRSTPRNVWDHRRSVRLFYLSSSIYIHGRAPSGYVSGLTARVLQDKLTYLEALANAHCPPLPELQENQGWISPYHDEPSVTIFNLNFDWPRSRSPESPVFLYKTEYLSDTRESMMRGEIKPRVASLFQELENDPQASVTLLEGLFRISHVTSLSVFAKVQYSPEAASNARYRIVCSVYDILKLSVSPP